MTGYHVLLLLFATVVAGLKDHDVEALKATEGFEDVTCGSLIKLAHVGSGHYLTSQPVHYGSGSAQQVVSGSKQWAETDTLWQIKGTEEQPCNHGTPVVNSQKIRLIHVNTEVKLHSHAIRSPLGKQHEVSGFEGSNDEDNWEITILNGEKVLRGQKVWLRHVSTGGILDVNVKGKFSQPLDGHVEVHTVPQGTPGDKNGWVFMEGYYFKRIQE
eukprot:Clim_evm11s39 gene=Clim_evmTU11s39